MKRISQLMIFVLFSGCESIHSAPDASIVSGNSFSPTYDINTLSQSTSFDNQIHFCRIADKALNEISGITESASSSGNFWVEEDSGNENKIYLISSTGKTIGIYRMTTVDDRDWEDMSISVGPIPGVHYIYLAETGDNLLTHSVKYIYRFPEPEFVGKQIPIIEDISIVDKIAFQYPDGIKNAEAIFVDPSSLDLYIVTKESRASVYVLHYPQSTSKITTATKLGTLPIANVTSAAISPDGNEIQIKNYNNILYWRRQSSESIVDIFKRTPELSPYQAEAKGEAICWANSGSGYFTTSEMIDTTAVSINFYKRR